MAGIVHDIGKIAIPAEILINQTYQTDQHRILPD